MLSSLVFLYCCLSPSLAFGGHSPGIYQWQQWIPGSSYGKEFFVAANATNDASCAFEFANNVTVYMGDPNSNATVYQDVEVMAHNICILLL